MLGEVPDLFRRIEGGENLGLLYVHLIYVASTVFAKFNSKSSCYLRASDEPAGARPPEPWRVGKPAHFPLLTFQHFLQHAVHALLPGRQRQAEGGLQFGRVQARVVRPLRWRGEGARGYRGYFFCYYFNSCLHPYCLG